MGGIQAANGRFRKPQVGRQNRDCESPLDRLRRLRRVCDFHIPGLKMFGIRPKQATARSSNVCLTLEDLRAGSIRQLTAFPER
jgi:hypothetical protein